MSISYDVVTQTGVTKVTSQSSTRDLEDDDLEGAFTIHVTHGHLIRSLIHVLRDILAYGIFELTPTTLRLLRLDKSECVIVSFDIDTSKFFQYLFVSRKSVIRIGISFALLWQCVKVIGKQDPFIMSKAEGDGFFVLDFGNAAKQQYPLQGVCAQTISVPTYLSRQPNIFITVKELTKAMSYLRTERGRAHIKGYRDRLVIEAMNGKKIQRMGVPFDDVWRRINIKPEELLTMMQENPNLACSLHLNEEGTAIAELETSKDYPKFGSPGAIPTVDTVQSHLVLKSLSKVYTIAPNSSILVTVEAEKPIRLSIPIGDYGHLTLYILSSAYGSGNSEVVGSLDNLAAPLSSILASEEITSAVVPPSANVPPSSRSSRRRKKPPPPPPPSPVVVQVEETVVEVPKKRSSARRKTVGAPPPPGLESE